MKFYTFLSVLTLAATTAAVQAQAIETKAKNALLMDYDTGEYLYEKNAFTAVPPASMSKLMTIYILFSKIKDGSLSLEDSFTVSENAWRKGGAASGSSTMFLPIGAKVTVENLIKGILIQSGNDACIVVAENLAGSEEDFAVKMNEKAAELGLKHSHFENSTGLPSPDHKMSSEDLAILARALIHDFPEFYPIFSQKTFTYNNIVQGNRNPLLYTMQDADGLKTGHTDEAGYCLTASAKRGGRRLIEVMSGMSSNRERSEEAERLMSWGFREFNNFKILNKGQAVAEAKVWYGKDKTVKLTVADDVLKTVHRSQQDNVKVAAEFDEPVKAPIKAGQEIGTIKIEIDGQAPLNVPLVAANDVAETGMLGKFWANLKYFVFGAK